MLSVFVTYYN